MSATQIHSLTRYTRFILFMSLFNRLYERMPLVKKRGIKIPVTLDTGLYCTVLFNVSTLLCFKLQRSINAKSHRCFVTLLPWPHCRNSSSEMKHGSCYSALRIQKQAKKILHFSLMKVFETILHFTRNFFAYVSKYHRSNQLRMSIYFEYSF